MDPRPSTLAPSPPARPGRARARGLRLALVLVGLGLFAAYFRRPLFQGNLAAVEGGEVYRSAQPRGDVAALIEGHGLGSILNLRGGGPDDPWYVAEVEATKATNVEFWDMPMSAVRRPTRRELLALLDVLDRCAYPLLVHCKSGSDRTGLAVGLYQMYRRGVAPGPAESAFSLAHGHVPLLGPERLHEPFDEYAAYLAHSGLDHTPARLRDWLTRTYRSDDPPGPTRPLAPGPRPRRR